MMFVSFVVLLNCAEPNATLATPSTVGECSVADHGDRFAPIGVPSSVRDVGKICRSRSDRLFWRSISFGSIAALSNFLPAAPGATLSRPVIHRVGACSRLPAMSERDTLTKWRSYAPVPLHCAK
jgi:hypothetical protein